MRVKRNPYESVDWSSVNYLHSFTHWHITTQSLFDEAYAAGIRHFPISHYIPSAPKYPLSDFFTNIPEDALGCPNAEQVTPDNMYHMCHFNSLGSFFESLGHAHPNAPNQPGAIPPYQGLEMTWQEAFVQIFLDLQYSDGGGITINHPEDSFYSSADCENSLYDLLDFDPRVLGIEIYSHYNEWTYYDLWQEILSTGRFAMGFAVVDWTNVENYPQKGRSVLLLPEVTEHEALKAYRKGAFFAALLGEIKFTRIETDGFKVDVETDAADSIDFITQDGVIKTVADSAGSYDLTGNETFVRIEAKTITDTIFSQPLCFERPLMRFHRWHC